ncbi:hypothetical protein GCM10020001_097540 [Nonomuraea salmonea]
MSTARLRTSTQYIPPIATSAPLNTDVTRKLTPVELPTSPLARSRPSSGTSRVTRVGSAIVLMLPTMTPTISSTTITHRTTLPGSVKVSSGTAR